MKIPNKSSTLTIVILLLLAVINVVGIITYGDINEDEALFAENSYHLAEEGQVRSELFEGLGIGLEKIQLQYHKLFIAAGALSVKLFGPNLYGFRLLTILFSIAFIITYYKYNIQKEAKTIALLALSLLFIQSTFSSFSVIFRPEIMVMFLGFCSWIFLEKYHSKNERKYLLLSGIFAGLATLTHLNGLIFILSGASFLLFKSKFKDTILFTVSATIIALLYFWDIYNAELFALWLEQFKNDPTQIGKNTNILLEPVIRLMSEHKRFFHSGEEIALSLLFFVSLAFGWKKLRSSHNNILLYLLFLIVFLALISHGKTVKYQILYMPFMAMIIAITFEAVSKRKKYIIMLLLALFCSVNIYSNYKKSNFDYNPIEMNRTISTKLEKGSKVLAKERFFFNEGTKFTINSSIGFAWYYERYLKEKYTLDDFFEFCKKYEIRYIVIDRYAFEKKLLNFLKEEDLSIGRTLSGYKVTDNTDNYIILEVISNENN